MAKFTVTLFAEGDRVAVADGEHKGRAGVVAAWLRIAADHPDPIHLIRLDEAIKVDAKISKRADGALVEEPAHRVEQIEVPASQLQSA
jgi:ribosomal protein L24